MKEFEYVLDQMGYKYQLSESLKYWTVVPKGWQKPIRLYNEQNAGKLNAIMIGIGYFDE